MNAKGPEGRKTSRTKRLPLSAEGDVGRVESTTSVRLCLPKPDPVFLLTREVTQDGEP
jgi:hypothetical protein